MKLKVFTISILNLLLAINVIGQNQLIKKRTPELSAYNFGSLGKLAPLEQLAVLKKTDYKGIILNSQTKSDTVNLDVFLTALKKNKHFKIHAVMVRYDFTDPVQKREGWKIIVDKIANKNIEIWVIFGKKAVDITDNFIETKLKEVVEYAKTKQVKVILYPHSNCYIASAEEALPFVQKINDPNLQLAVHLCHEIRAGNGARISSVFENVKQYIGAVTLAGTDSMADFSKPKLMDTSTIKPIGQGNFNMAKFIEPLRKSGYKGMVGFINFKIEDDPKTYLKNSMMEWRELNKELKNYTTR
jgi:sugar phosphate isomerase/epimerase